MIKQPLNTITAAITIIFTEGKEQNRSEQVLIYIWVNQNVRKSTKVRSAGAKPERKERSFSTQLISQEKVMSWRLIALKETDLSGFCTEAP